MMNDLQKNIGSNVSIQKHNFDTEVQKLKDFASSVPPSPTIKKFDENGSFWGFTDHNVTGAEMNQHVIEVSKLFVEQNSLIVKTIKEFQVVYETFNKLDKDYISGIVAALEGTNRAIIETTMAQHNIETVQSNILATQNDLKKANKQIEDAQNDINGTIEALKATVSSYSIFKNETKELLKAVENEIAIIKAVQQNILEENKSELISIITDMKEEAQAYRTKTQKQFKWAFAVGGSSLFLNLVFIILKCLGVL